ncbi:hypothetical protein SO802_033300 [Lithocarpus litseifolius]|uniref:Rapid ALkalinization Factor n=1 Tax=Lithocarpus litseifolius TaxID=425828 RepID=A0AAW2BI59_9ROSI
MANSTSFIMVFHMLLITTLMMISSTNATLDHSLSWVPRKTSNHCQGSIAECMADGNEFDMDSEINRRILATTQYISYAALQRNTVPCSLRGASYYNCKAGAEANPYNRGCSAITQCRS